MDIGQLDVEVSSGAPPGVLTRQYADYNPPQSQDCLHINHSWVLHGPRCPDCYADMTGLRCH